MIDDLQWTLATQAAHDDAELMTRLETVLRRLQEEAVDIAETSPSGTVSPSPATDEPDDAPAGLR